MDQLKPIFLSLSLSLSLSLVLSVSLYVFQTSVKFKEYYHHAIFLTL
jgi:hypothetical protein